MLAELDFAFSSRQATVSVTGRVLFPVYHAEAASSEAASSEAASSEAASVLCVSAEERLGDEADIFNGWIEWGL